MRILSLQNLELNSIVQALQRGETLVYPTETCYGLGCDPHNEEAVQKLFQIKKRQEDKPMLVVFPDVSLAMKYIDWSPELEKITSQYWPGPLTIVTRLKNGIHVSPLLIGKDGTLAFRVSSHPLVQEITEALHSPLVSTSANIAGEDNPYDAREIIARFSVSEFQPDIVIDAEVLPFAAPSTIVKLVDGKIEVLRQGEVKIDPKVIL